MTKKRATINVTGMNRDQAKGLMDSKFTFENMNIRITARDESNTSLAVTNEKGTKRLDVDVYGTPVGVFSCDSYFGIFSFKRVGVKYKDHITVYKKDGDDISVFFHWQGFGLGFHDIDVDKHRIETEVSVEATNSIRVYWVDGVHQPRVIDFMKLQSTYGSECETIAASYFNFLPEVKDITDVKIEKAQSGYFYSGTVQFVITEVINGNESNIVYYSPLYYASDDANNRGYKPDNTSAGTAFRVSFSCEDNSLISYFIIYAIYRSSQDGAAVVVKREVQSCASASILVAGNEEAVDSSYLLFLNRQPMVGAQTITQKDGVMFLANWQTNTSASDSYATDIDVVTKAKGRSFNTATFTENGASISSQLKLNSFEIGHFKRGESYLLGYQLMDKNGYWQTPKCIKNGDGFLFEMDKAPVMDGSKAYLPHFEAEVSGGSEYIKARPVIAYVDDAQKPCLYQGIVTPTIYSEKERVEGTCFAKLSPFTRSFRVFGSDFKPSMLWANPPKIITEKGIQNLSADVYENAGADGAVHSYLGFEPTSIDAGVTEKTSMKYGTYPAAQHLQALGTTKDYNNEFQTSWRYRDVVFKTALIPKSDDNRGSSDAANKIQKFEVLFNIHCTKGDDAWTSTWSDYFYAGKGTDSNYYLAYWISGGASLTKVKIDESTYNSLADSSSSSEAIKALLWTDTNAIYGAEKTDEDGNGTGYWNARTLLFGASIDNVSGGSLTVYADCNSSWYETQFESKISDTNSTYSKKITGLLSSLFGVYTIDSSASGNDNSTDVFTCDNASYFVDASMVTLHSPDITDSTALSKNDGSINIVGAVRMNGFTSDTSIVAQTAKLNNKMPGSAGFQNLRPASNESGRCAMALPNWCSAWWSNDMELAPFWTVSPFGVSDYLAQENDAKEISDRVASKLTYHQLANYRFCDMTAYEDIKQIDKCAIEAAFGNTTGIKSLGTDRLVYHPAEDGIIAPSLAYFWSNGPFYTANGGYRARGAAGGIKPVNKFKNWQAGQIWQQLGFSGTWLKAQDLSTLLFTNILPMLSIMDSSSQNRGSWHNGGTIDDVDLKCDALTLNTKTLGYQDDNFIEKNINDLDGGEIKVCPYSDCGNFGNGGFWDSAEDPTTYTISAKYRANPHFAIKLPNPLDNYTYLAKYAISKKAKYCSKGWNGGNTVTSLEDSDIADWKNYVDVPTSIRRTDGDYLWLVDIVNNTGTPSVEPSTAQWMIAGEAVDLVGNKATVKWVQGNWYFQRFDCLRTYPETVEEKSQVVEIVSFMCETRRNLDGRYDTHGGQAFLQANPNNYNLINDAYTQKNNFFSYSIPSVNDNVVSTYPTTVTWSLQKTLNSNVDAWTSITGASLLDMEGDKGPIVHLTRLGNNLLCFQPSGISAISYNERTPLATEEGMPVELAMSGKVEGKQYIANAAGAERNTNIVTTDRAVYFVDSYNKTMCMLSEGVKLLSEELGFHSWMATLTSPNLMRMHYDRKNNCVMGSNVSTAIVFSELLGQYESFMNYEGTRELINAQDKTLILHQDMSDDSSQPWALWELNGGDYNSFFGKLKDYWIDMLIGGTPTDKIFDNVEFRGDLLKNGDQLTVKKCPFNTIRAYNEYQDSEEKPLKFNQFSISNLKNRFRSWFAYVPRNAERRQGRILERMRNPWCHIVLLMRQPEETEETGRAQVQELNIDYTE